MMNNELSELKKQVLQMLNKRSVAISARFSGDLQDKRIHEVTQLLGGVENEIRRIEGSRKKIVKEGGKTSSILVDNGKQNLPLDKLLVKLDDIGNAYRDKVRYSTGTV